MNIKHRNTSEYRRNYYRTPKGRASYMWTSLIGRAGNKFGTSKSYEKIKVSITREWFLKWAEQELNQWVKNHEISDASLDRIHNDKGYEEGNLQILTRHDNTLKQARYKNVQAPEGKAWCSKCKDHLDIIYFSNDKYSFNGLVNKCKSCIKEIDHKRYFEKDKLTK